MTGSTGYPSALDAVTASVSPTTAPGRRGLHLPEPRLNRGLNAGSGELASPNCRSPGRGTTQPSPPGRAGGMTADNVQTRSGQLPAMVSGWTLTPVGAGWWASAKHSAPVAVVEA